MVSSGWAYTCNVNHDPALINLPVQDHDAFRHEVINILLVLGRYGGTFYRGIIHVDMG